MSKKPIINAVAAAGYIALVASMMFYAPKFEDSTPTVLIPIAMLSLFTLSAAVMGYLFVYQPLLLILEGDKKGGLKLFLQTVGVFAAITALAFLALFMSATAR